MKKIILTAVLAAATLLPMAQAQMRVATGKAGDT